MAKGSNQKRNARRVISIPKDVVLSPQAELPRGPVGQDRSGGRSAARELTWAQFDRKVQALGRAVKKDWDPDVVVGVAHGGVFVGGALAPLIGCEFFPVRISRRSRDRAPAGSPRMFGEMPKELKGRKVLVVDDVVSSGDTLELAVALAKKVGATEVQTCTLLARPDGYAPRWISEETEEFWVFPWDYDLSLFGNLQGLEAAPSRAAPAKGKRAKAKAR